MLAFGSEVGDRGAVADEATWRTLSPENAVLPPPRGFQIHQARTSSIPFIDFEVYFSLKSKLMPIYGNRVEPTDGRLK